MTQAAPEPEDGEASAVELEAAGIARTPAGAAVPIDDDLHPITALKYDLLRRGRRLYDRLIDERWATATIHKFPICPVCAAVVMDKAGQAVHRNWHHGEEPSLAPILHELEGLLDLLRTAVDDQ